MPESLQQELSAVLSGGTHWRCPGCGQPRAGKKPTPKNMVSVCGSDDFEPGSGCGTLYFVAKDGTVTIPTRKQIENARRTRNFDSHKELVERILSPYIG